FCLGFALFQAKPTRTCFYRCLWSLLPFYLADHGMSATGIGLAVTCTLVGSAGLTWAVRRPAERLGARAALSALAVLSALSAALLLASEHPWIVVLAATVGNVAVGTGETGPLLSIEPVA